MAVYKPPYVEMGPLKPDMLVLYETQIAEGHEEPRTLHSGRSLQHVRALSNAVAKYITGGHNSNRFLMISKSMDAAMVI